MMDWISKGLLTNIAIVLCYFPKFCANTDNLWFFKLILACKNKIVNYLDEYFGLLIFNPDVTSEVKEDFYI